MAEGVLESLAKFYSQLPFEVLLVGHCLAVSSWFLPVRDRFLISYWIGLSAAFGGGILSSLLLQDPVQAPIALFALDSVGLIWTFCWWLMNYFPFGVVASLHSILPVRMLSKTCLNILRAGVVAQRVDLAVAKYPGVVAAPLILGTIGGSGGKFLVDAIFHSFGMLHGPAEFHVPTFAVRSGLVVSFLHWLLVHQLHVLSKAEGMALITTMLVVHGWVSDLTGSEMDFTYPIARTVHTLTNVPMPGSISAKQSRPNSASAVQSKAAEPKKEK